MRQRLTKTLILGIVLSLVVVVALLGMRTVNKPLEATITLRIGGASNPEETSTRQQLMTEAIATRDTLEATATAIMLEAGVSPSQEDSPAMTAEASALPDGLPPSQTLASYSTEAEQALASPVQSSVATRTLDPSSTPTATPVPGSTPAAIPQPAEMLPTPTVVVIIAPTWAEASSEAACSRDSQLNPVCYSADNLLDGQLDTAWRESLSAAPSIEFELPAATTITKIALVSGYAKIDAFDGTDRWYQNHRPRHVKVYLDEAEEGVYELTDSREWQAIDLLPKRTQRIRLVILDSYPPLDGNRPYVAISELRVIGFVP